jgi:hypothetical protein
VIGGQTEGSAFDSPIARVSKASAGEESEKLLRAELPWVSPSHLSQERSSGESGLQCRRRSPETATDA